MVAAKLKHEEISLKASTANGDLIPVATAESGEPLASPERNILSNCDSASSACRGESSLKESF